MHRKSVIAVIGTANASEGETKIAREVGRLIAERGWVLATGGLSGVMEAASRGAAEAGGTVVGILPQGDPAVANPHVTISIATNMGYARNAIIAQTAEALIAVGGAYGTLTEIAMGLNLKKPVIGIGTWEIKGVTTAADAAAAVNACAQLLSEGRRNAT